MTPGEKRKAEFRALSLEKRYPRILARTLAGVDDPAIIAAIERLDRFLSGAAPFEAAKDIADPAWAALHAANDGRDAPEIGFLDLEYLAFDGILRAHRYETRQIDPFAADKALDIDAGLAACEAVFARIGSVPAALRTSLFGNAHDASQLVIQSAGTLLDPEALALPEGTGRIDIVCDNAGQEFLADLVLAGVLLRTGATRVTLHVKAMPWFVSDVTCADAEAVFAAAARGDGAADGLCATLMAARAEGRLVLEADPLWTRPLGFTGGHLTSALGPERGAVILKGDLNYRRTMDDLSIDVFTPIAALPAGPDRPLLSLRSVKSHCWVGMSREGWPDGVDPDAFPTDGTLFLAQSIPGRGGDLVSNG